MTLAQRVKALTTSYGTPVKFAVEMILQTFLPGSPALIELVAKTFDTVQETAEDSLAADAHLAQLASADELQRIEGLLDTFSQQLPDLLSRLAGLEQVPATAAKILNQTQISDARFAELGATVNAWGEQFEILAQHHQGLVVEQRKTNSHLTSMHGMLRAALSSQNHGKVYSPDDERLLRATRLSQRAEGFLRNKFNAAGSGLGECLRSVNGEVRKLDLDLAKALAKFVPIRNVLMHNEEHEIDGAEVDVVLQAVNEALQRHVKPKPAKSVPVRPRQLLVCSSGLGDYTTISSAVLAASAGDTIFVMPGSYHEAITIDKPVSIIGQGGQPDEVVISVNGDVLEVESSNIWIKNMTLLTTAAPEAKAFVAHILPGNDEVRFTKCHFQAPNGTGVIARTASRILVTECRFEQCHLALRLEGWAVVAHSVFARNQTGLLARRSADCTVENCQFDDHEVAVQLRDQVLARLAVNGFTDDECAIVATDQVSGTLEGNRFVNCPSETQFVRIAGAEGLLFSA